MEGVVKFLEDLQLDPRSRTVLIIAWKFKAQQQCEFSKDEFFSGMMELGEWMVNRMFHRTTIWRGDNYTGKNFVPPIKTRSPVVKAVKLMACRQAQSPLKITT